MNSELLALCRKLLKIMAHSDVIGHSTCKLSTRLRWHLAPAATLGASRCNGSLPFSNNSLVYMISCLAHLGHSVPLSKLQRRSVEVMKTALLSESACAAILAVISTWPALIHAEDQTIVPGWAVRVNGSCSEPSNISTCGTTVEPYSACCPMGLQCMKQFNSACCRPGKVLLPTPHLACLV